MEHEDQTYKNGHSAVRQDGHSLEHEDQTYINDNEVVAAAVQPHDFSVENKSQIYPHT